MDIITKEQYYDLLAKFKELEEELSKFKVKKDWYEENKTLVIKSEESKNERVEIECNYDSWKYVKEQNLLHEAMLIAVIEDEIGYTTSISLDGMKQLRDYLNEKIEYLEFE